MREENDRLDIICKYEFRVRFSIEEEIELYFGVSLHYAAEGLIGDPAYPFEFVFQQQTSIYSYFQLYNSF